MLRKLFVFAVCLMAAVTTASAQTPPYNEIWYTTTDGRPLFINRGYKRSVGLYMYSDTYNNGRGVLKFESGGYIGYIDFCLFDGSDRLKSITIPNSVTSIGDDAFNNCNSLKSITISKSVTKIGKEAFRGCSSLKSITIPESVTSIGWYAFFGCSSLTSITIPNRVTIIEHYAFSGCSSLTSITIGNSATNIEEGAFSGCSSLKSFKSKFASEDSRCLIIDGELIAFAPAGLTSYTIPNSVTSIGGAAFKGYSSLKSITIPNSVTSIGSWAFGWCSSLTSITIPNSVTSIGYEAFQGCDNLKSVKVSNKYCYDYFKKLGVSDITFIVSTLEEYEEAQKLGATKLAIDSNSKYASEDGIYLIDNGKLILFIGKDLTEYTIPESVTSIVSGAFDDCSSLKSVKVSNKYCYDYFKDKVANIAFYGANASADGRCLIVNGELQRFIAKGITEYTIPNSVTSIGREAFVGCSSQTSITIPNSITSIGGSAFSGCSSITSITIPNSVTEIGGYAFEDCSSLKSITIGNSVTSIDSYAFKGCSRLKSVKVSNKYCYDYFKDKVDDIAFYGANASDYGRCLIIDGKLERFIAKGITEYTIPESVTSIGEWAFKGCSNLTSITIPNSVISIEKGAFEDCSSLKSVKVANEYCYDYFKDKVANIAFYGANASDDGRCLIIDGELKIFTAKGITEYTIPNSVTSIGDEAFKGCSSLTSIAIPNSVTSIRYEAFKGCSSLTSITIPDSVKSIGYQAFYGCRSLKSITIPNSVTNIGNEAFHYCNSLTSITIGNSVTSIGESAFKGCSSLTSITIPNSVTSIGRSTFRGCSSLTSITIPDSVKSIGYQAFYGCSLTSITIGNSVTSIGKDAFYNCDNLTSITCLATTPPAIDDLSIAETTMIYVPKKAVKAYKKGPKWSIYKKQIKAIK